PHDGRARSSWFVVSRSSLLLHARRRVDGRASASHIVTMTRERAYVYTSMTYSDITRATERGDAARISLPVHVHIAANGCTFTVLRRRWSPTDTLGAATSIRSVLDAIYRPGRSGAVYPWLEPLTLALACDSASVMVIGSRGELISHTDWP